MKGRGKIWIVVLAWICVEPAAFGNTTNEKVEIIKDFMGQIAGGTIMCDDRLLQENRETTAESIGLFNHQEFYFERVSKNPSVLKAFRKIKDYPSFYSKLVLFITLSPDHTSVRSVHSKKFDVYGPGSEITREILSGENATTPEFLIASISCTFDL